MSTGSKNEYSKEFEKAYGILNPQQKEAVDTIEGPVIVVAGPGTGKTQILTLRIANIIKKFGASAAENVLALTFTNAGVFAMRERLSDFVGIEMAYQVNIFTFHSFAEEQIKQNPDYFSQFAYSQPATDIEQIEIIEQILKETELEYLKTFASYEHYTKGIVSAIGKLKQEAISPDDFLKKIEQQKGAILADESSYYKRNTANARKGDLKPNMLKPIEKNKELKVVYEKYQEVLKSRRLYDFADMILSVVQAAETNTEFRSLLQDQYQYLLVDEHQDTNNAQSKIIELIGAAEATNNRPNIFTVGDEKQAIYAFQGASLENFLKFREQYDDVKVVNLDSNYRSSQQILDSAHNVLSGNERLQAKNPTVANLGHKVKLAEMDNYKEELIFLAEDVKRRIDGGENPDSIALFYRQNNNLFEIKDILDKYKIPYKVFSRESILDNREIKKIIMYLRAIANPYNDELLAQLLFVDFLKLDTFDILKVLHKMHHRGKERLKNKSILKIISSKSILKQIEVEDSSNFAALAKSLRIFKKKAEGDNFLEFFEAFINKSGFLKHVMKLPDSAAALKRLEKIFDEARQQFFTKKDYNLNDFLGYIDLLEKYKISMDLGQDNLGQGVNLMTAHGSKGLEFDTVYITNFVDNSWPGRKMGDSFKLPISQGSADIDDTRRLFYVALTRGKQEVIISYSKLSLEGKEQKVSRFLTEIGENFIEPVETKGLNIADKIGIFFKEKKQAELSIFSTEYIKEEFLKNSLSVSAFNNYVQSPLLYFFRNLIRLPGGQNKLMILGNVVHKTLEDFFKASATADKILAKSKMLEMFQVAIDTTIMLEEYYDEIRKRGEQILEEYYQEYYSSFELNIETEKEVITSMKLRNGETLKLYGVIDKIEKMPDGKIRVVDYKTGKTYKAKGREQKEALHRQLVFYKLILDKHYKALGQPEVQVAEGVLDFVEKNKDTGEYEQKILSVSTEEVKALEEEILDFADDIMSGDFLKRKYEKDNNTRDFFDLWELRG